MPMPPHNRRVSRAAVAAVGAAGLIALGAAPAAFGDETAPELVIGGIEPIGGVKPGSSFDLPVTVANKGTEAAEKVWVSYSVTRGLDFAEVPSNCRVQQVPSYDEMPERWIAVCAFDQVVEPGVVYTPEKPLGVKALDRALNDELRVRVEDVDPGADENGTPPVAGTAPAVKLVEEQAGGEGSARFVDVPVTSVNTADYQVTGAALKGSVGDTVTMKVKFTNAGPAWVLTKEGEPLVRVMITPPAGTSVVKPHGFCEAEGEAYACGTSQRSVNEGGRETYTFELKIDKQVAGAKGSVALSTEARPFDPDKANDRADITLDVTDGGASGSSGSSGSTGSSTNGSDGSAGGSSSAGDDGTTTNGGNLAETGSSATPAIMGAAAAAVVTGAGTLLIVRRRRARSLN
ncbi:LAETG motif-containing sortase-dependent surface protein [Streptomyces sp. NPDC058231]|uniref:LAETG motif-containing sortase-dependent surface protein n=1 Tax=Streptomyces sp. NPDC058231 TaxID=3346392 RepID=UPI0036EE10A8